MRFADRVEAGRVLARSLGPWVARPDVIVLGLPRGGVIVAAEVARALAAPLDVLVVRKLGVPGHEEFAMGAVASGGVRVVDPFTIARLGISGVVLDHVTQRELRELDRRERAYRGDRTPAPVEDRVAILVDDGLATGATMRAAVEALRRRSPRRIVVAVPIGARDAAAAMALLADEVVCVGQPEPFWSVGTWYRDFRDTTDAEVRQVLDAFTPATAA
jgi:predicted phosphoribosyltransferase